MATAATQAPTAHLTIQSSIAWREWINGLAVFARTDRSKLIDQAVVELAASRGYTPPPPPRWPVAERETSS